MSAVGNSTSNQRSGLHFDGRRGDVDENLASEALVTLLRVNSIETAPASINHKPKGQVGPSPNRTGKESRPDGDVGQTETSSVAVPSASVIRVETDNADIHLDTPGDGAPIFLGESTTLRYVHSGETGLEQEDSSPASATQLLHQLPDVTRNATETNGDVRTVRPSHEPTWVIERRHIKIQFLHSVGALSFPPPTTVETLLEAYFAWFHPCFSILDEAEVKQRYRAGTLSPLLLQAMLFIAAIHTNNSIPVDELCSIPNGRTCSAEHDKIGDKLASAKFVLYSRCKDLYDADYERDKVTIIQAVFLMSFWRNGPFLEKDTRHWLATAISLAQSRAMHRSTDAVGAMPTKSCDKTKTVACSEGIKRRLWWSIYTREQQCAAALGLPSRISDDDCDLPPLQPCDFDCAFAQAPTIAAPSQFGSCDGVSYQVGAAALARILGRVIRYGYAPGRTLTVEYKNDLKQQLLTWKQQQQELYGHDVDESPREAVRLHSSSIESRSRPLFYIRLLHLAYNNLLILLYRCEYITANNSVLYDHINEGHIALQAAARNSRIVEDLLAESGTGGSSIDHEAGSHLSLQHAPLHVITNLFNTLCMHTIHLRRLMQETKDPQLHDRSLHNDGTGSNTSGNSTSPNTSTSTSSIHDVAARIIAEHRAKICLLGLQELQRTWDVHNWILQLFFHYLDRSTAARLSVEDTGGRQGPCFAAKYTAQRASRDRAMCSDADADTNTHTPNCAVGNSRSSRSHGTAVQIPMPEESAIRDMSFSTCEDDASTQIAQMLPDPWTMPEEQQRYLFTQMETDSFSLGEGGGLCGFWGQFDGLGEMSAVDAVTANFLENE